MGGSEVKALAPTTCTCTSSNNVRTNAERIEYSRVAAARRVADQRPTSCQQRHTVTPCPGARAAQARRYAAMVRLCRLDAEQNGVWG
mmetsp:Transcript_3679/g.8821  ORF Transcript_3679/g.8821 Transcript_3679/m.8821 type:complete len:87 (-) Transcript_3679:22-282(-)